MTQATLDSFELRPDGDVGAWRLAPDEPGYHGLRRYWGTEDYVLVANQSTNSFSVYDVETWESGILGQGNEPVATRSDCEDAGLRGDDRRTDLPCVPGRSGWRGDDDTVGPELPDAGRPCGDAELGDPGGLRRDERHVQQGAVDSLAVQLDGHQRVGFCRPLSGDDRGGRLDGGVSGNRAESATRVDGNDRHRRVLACDRERRGLAVGDHYVGGVCDDGLGRAGSHLPPCVFDCVDETVVDLTDDTDDWCPRTHW